MMRGTPGKQVLRSGLVWLCCLWLSGCAGLVAVFDPEHEGPPFRDPGMSMQQASETIAIGQATRADVSAALGPATAVKFDSGYEVWVYRGRLPESAAAGAGAEFVILFAPSGVVKKTRIRLPA